MVENIYFFYSLQSEKLTIPKYKIQSYYEVHKEDYYRY